MYITDILLLTLTENCTQRQYLQAIRKQSVFNTSMMIYKILISPECHIVNDFNSYFILIINKI